MSRREDRVRLQHMLSCSREAAALVRDVPREQVASNRVLCLALVRLLEIVGEAAARTTPETQAKHSQVPWSQIVGLRNRLIHGYESVDFDILWQILTTDLPPLISQLEQILASET